jgi:hypothetical protein
MRILGIDPGVSAGGALLPTNGGPPSVFDLPIVNNQINAGAFRRMVHDLQPDLGVVEVVHSMPGQGVASTFKFGMACGLIRGVLLGYGLPVVDVHPTVWKRHFKLAKGDGEMSRALACNRFPALEGLSRKKDHNRAEALLIALWRVETDDPV